jgi:oxygen-independent coproporphyrinogen-3 oxidase
MKETGLYIHIPFCRSKCHYCAFNSRPFKKAELAPYFRALLSHIDMVAGDPWCRDRKFSSLFIGGGTPTVCGTEELLRLIGHCRQSFSFIPRPEISIEGNPDTISLSMLSRLRRAGANRISIGVQSFDDELLQAIGRIHTAAQGTKAVQLAQQAGFDNVNVDLMFGLPGQTADQHEESIDIALSLGITHLAVYELMLEEGATLLKMLNENRLVLPDEETVIAMMVTLEERLRKAGFLRYEISNYGLPGFQCRHNVNYWRNGSYVGIGAGAVSNFSGLRLTNLKSPEAYCAALDNKRYPFSEGEALSEAARMRETVIMGLRMTEGVEFKELIEQFPRGISPDYLEIIGRLRSMQLMADDKKRLQLTHRGLMLANQVLSELV